jgi:hypothetical protein
LEPASESPIDRTDINAHLLALMDIKADVRRIRVLLEEDDVGGETEEDS